MELKDSLGIISPLSLLNTYVSKYSFNVNLNISRLSSTLSTNAICGICTDAVISRCLILSKSGVILSNIFLLALNSSFVEKGGINPLSVLLILFDFNLAFSNLNIACRPSRYISIIKNSLKELQAARPIPCNPDEISYAVFLSLNFAPENNLVEILTGVLSDIGIPLPSSNIEIIFVLVSIFIAITFTCPP